ncbi:MAG TPA: response regulator transcription factor [Thermoleophilaceae bacterium]|jgi:DNA-binding NarL/FixJ family response regulator|nr:response regulator transcription factor [Thermoleophilaceae bacterium]
MTTVDAPRVQVLVADDHGLIRNALAAFLDGIDDIEVVGLARDGEEAVELARTRHPRVVVMDVSMPRMDGVEATRRILGSDPNTKVVMLTGHADRERADAAMRAGAVAYVLKDRDPREIFEAILAATATW